MLKDFLRKRLLMFVIGSLGAVLIHVFQSKLGMDAQTASELADKVLTALSVYIGGQSATDLVAIYKGTKTN